MSADILGTSWDQCRSMVQYSFTSTEARWLVRTDSPGRPPRLSHSSWTMSVSPKVCKVFCTDQCRNLLLVCLDLFLESAGSQVCFRCFVFVCSLTPKIRWQCHIDGAFGIRTNDLPIANHSVLIPLFPVTQLPVFKERSIADLSLGEIYSRPRAKYWTNFVVEIPFNLYISCLILRDLSETFYTKIT